MRSEMDGFDLVACLERLRDATGAEDVRIWCSHEKLEHVWLVAEHGELVVTDLGESLKYLAEEGDPAYREVALADVSAICARCGVELDVSAKDCYPTIRKSVPSSAEPSVVVDSVAAAIDELFATATNYRDNPETRMR